MVIYLKMNGKYRDSISITFAAHMINLNEIRHVVSFKCRKLTYLSYPMQIVASVCSFSVEYMGYGSEISLHARDRGDNGRSGGGGNGGRKLARCGA
eukprot:6211991-Pleurochrysis_carterae.AAC.6